MTLVQGKCGQGRFILPVRQVTDPQSFGAADPNERLCRFCELPPGSRQCGNVGRTGRWFRNGTSIVVNC